MYITLVIVAFVLYALAYAANRDTLMYQNRDSVYLITWFLLATVIMGLRSVNVGTDTLSYSNHFNDISSARWSTIFSNLHFLRYNSLEIGYVCLAKICSMVVNDYIFFQFVLAAIYCFAMMSFLRENVKSKIILTTVFLGSELYLFAFNISRQMIAVALTALSWNYLCKNKKQKAILLMILSASFHMPSMVFLIAYIFYLIRKKRILFNITVFVGIIAAINYKFVINFVFTHLGKYAYYLGNINYWANAKIKQRMGLSVIVYSIVLMLAIYILLKKCRFTVNEKAYAVFSAIYVICNFMGLYFNYFERVGIYFLPFVILEIDAVAQKIKSKDVRKLYVSSVSICYSLYFLVSAASAQYVYHFWGKN